MNTEVSSLTITGSTNATSTTTGALIITGGLGAEKDITVGGICSIPTPYVAFIHYSTGQSITASTLTRCTMDSVNYDPASMRSGNALVAPVSGYYLVWNQVYIAQSVGAGNQADDSIYTGIERTDTSDSTIEYRYASHDMKTQTAAPQIGMYNHGEAILYMDATDKVYSVIYNATQNCSIGLSGDYPHTSPAMGMRFLGTS